MKNEIISYMKKRSQLAKKYHSNPKSHNKDLPVNTATEYLNPGRLRNVLRTFNLCPVSTRYRGQREESYPTECSTSRF